MIHRIPAWYLFFNASAESARAEAVGAIEAGTAPHAEKVQRENKIGVRLGRRTQFHRT